MAAQGGQPAGYCVRHQAPWWQQASCSIHATTACKEEPTNRKFETLASVVQAVQAFVQHHALAELVGDMPNSRVLRRAGEAHLSNCVCRHGVAKAAGLQYYRKVGPVCSSGQFRMSCGVRCKVSAIKLLPLHEHLSS